MADHDNVNYPLFSGEGYQEIIYKIPQNYLSQLNKDTHDQQVNNDMHIIHKKINC